MAVPTALPMAQQRMGRRAAAIQLPACPQYHLIVPEPVRWGTLCLSTGCHCHVLGISPGPCMTLCMTFPSAPVRLPVRPLDILQWLPEACRNAT